MDKAVVGHLAAGCVADNRGKEGRIISSDLTTTRPEWSTSECLARIDASNDAIRAVTALDRAGALTAADASAGRRARGQPLSDVDGMPLLVKANIAVAGLPWHAGIAAYRDRIATRDAPCVARLRAAGAVILGLTNMDEGALGATTDHPWLGRTDNPRAPGFSAGGSSGGSAAAVAAGFCVAALGTDTIGSVRIPAGYCGVVGHKPGFGTIPIDDVVPLVPSLDTVGVLAASAALCRTVSAILSGGVSEPSPVLGTRRLAILDLADWPGLSPDVSYAFLRTVDAASARGLSKNPVALSPEQLSRLQKLLFMLAEIEGAEIHYQALADHPEGFSPAFQKMLEWGAGAGAARLAAIRAEIGDIRQALTTTLDGSDALLMPTTATPAFDVSGPAPSNQGVFAALASALGWPATAFPVKTAGALPVSTQIMSHTEALCLDLAACLEQPAQA